MTTAVTTQQTGVSLPRRDSPRPLYQNASETVNLQPATLTRPVPGANLSPAPITPPAPPPSQPKLLDRLREALPSRHSSRRTEQCYCH